MIHFFLGKPGGGKSYRALREIVDELVYGERVIVTNVALRLPELNAWLQKNHPTKSVDLHERIRILDEDEARHFYLHRETGKDFTQPGDEETKRGARVDYGDMASLRPVMYVIDEVHVFFDARNWMATGPHVTFYNSQHRKAGDEIFFITQFLDLVDKRLKGFSQDFILIRNYKLERLFLFRGPPYHGAKTYQSPPTGLNAIACHEEFFTLDLELAACYNTTAGVGMISGRTKPQERRMKGLHPAFAVVAVVGAIVGLWYLPDLISAGVLKAIGGATEGVNQAVSPVAKHEERPEGSPDLPRKVEKPANEPAQPPTGVFVAGYVVKGDKINVVLTDGRVFTEGDAGLGKVMRNGAFVNGEFLFLRPVERTKSAPPEVEKRDT